MSSFFTRTQVYAMTIHLVSCLFVFCKFFPTTIDYKNIASLSGGRRPEVVLEAVLLLQVPVLLDERVDAVDHLLDQLHL